jgi:hypothetical protein
MAKQPNYTDEMTAKVVEMYVTSENDNSVDNLEAIAVAVGKTAKSIRAKLVKEGAYVVVEKSATKVKDDGPTKKDLINDLTDLTGLELAGIDGANKPALTELVEFLRAQDVEVDVSMDDSPEDQAAR